MSARDFDWAAGVLRSVVMDCEGLLPATDVANIWEFVDVGELGLAFETLCTQLYEYEAAVNAEVLRSLGELREYFGLDSRLWLDLEG